MKIYKIKCKKCGKKYSAHRRIRFNPSFTLDYRMRDLLVDKVLLLSLDQDGIVRTECQQCGGKLKGYYIKVKKNAPSVKNKK